MRPAPLGLLGLALISLVCFFVACRTGSSGDAGQGAGQADRGLEPRLDGVEPEPRTWLLPELGAERLAAAHGFEFQLSLNPGSFPAIPRRVELVFSEQGGTSANEAGEPVRLGSHGVPESCSSETCRVAGRSTVTLAPGPGLLTADFYGDGDVLLCRTSNAVVVNSPPQVEQLVLVPMPPSLGQSVEARAEYSDADGDELLVSHQFRSAAGRELAVSLLPASELSPGESWTYQLLVQDPFEERGMATQSFRVEVPEEWSARYCEAGARLQGLSPPWGKELWCEREAENGDWLRDGFHRRWWSSEEDLLVSEEQWALGRRDGRWTSFYRDGKKAEERTYLADQLSGPARAWHDNGRLSAEYRFVAGVKQGIELNWFRDGTLRYRMDSFAAGRRNGLENRWFSSGQMQQEFLFLSGRVERSDATHLSAFWQLISI